jgi:phage-related minor tail protein
MADIKVRVGQQNSIKVVSSISGDTSGTLSGLSDVNASTLSNGMVLVYNSATNKWDATLELTPGTTQNLDINGGSF